MMGRGRIKLLALCLALTAALGSAQTHTTQRRKAAATQQARKRTATKSRSTLKKVARRGTEAKPRRKQAKARGGTSIKGLKSQSTQIKKNIREQERRLRSNERSVKKRLQNLMVINTEIADKRKAIDTIRHDISRLDGNIVKLDGQLDELQRELDDRKQKYVKSMRYMHRNRSLQNQLMFVFSARNFTQMFRRMRFMREYATYQRVQGEMVKSKRAQVEQKRRQITSAKQQKGVLLDRGIREHRTLEGKQVEQQKVVTSLQREQKTIQRIIAEQRKKDEAINAKIDRLVAIEVEKARQRAIAEAKRKAEKEAARRRAEELARKKAEAEAAAKARARRIAEARAREERLKAEARAAANRSARERRAAEAAAREAEQERRETERRARQEAKAHEREVAEARKSTAQMYTADSEDRRISGSFASNRGRLPVPVAGSYHIVSHYGQYNVEGLKNVRLDNKGINIQGAPGAQVRSIFDGEVTAVFSTGGGSWGVLVRHGSYISVYCNLGRVAVSRGQKVSTRQALGTVGAENILQFQLRREKAKLNPEAWLGR